MIGVETVGQPDRALQQTGLDTRPIQNADGCCKLVAKRIVALEVGGMDRLEKRAQLRLVADQGQILHRRGQRRENELGAGMADDTLPVGASGAHQDLKLLGCGAAAQPLSEDANDHIEWMNAL